MSDYSRDFAVSYGADGSCRIAFRCFDAANSITLYGCPEPEPLLLEARRRCLGYHALWSFSDPESDIARANAPVGRVRLHPETSALLRRMLEFHETEPSFDPTVGAASYLWKHVRETGEPPSEADLRAALSHVGAEKLHLEGDVLVKDDPLLQVDVGGAAKGFVADRLAAYLRSEDATCADVDLGGNLYLVGEHPQGRPWRLEVELPDDLRRELDGSVAFEAADTSVVTSGSLERTVEVSGKNYQHIVDSATGRPSPSDVVSATVLSPDSCYADMLATAAVLVGSGGLGALASRHPDAGLVVVTRAGHVFRRLSLLPTG